MALKEGPRKFRCCWRWQLIGIYLFILNEDKTFLLESNEKKKRQVPGHDDFDSLGYLKHKIQKNYCFAGMSLS